jgi:hypothetical protein
LLNSATNDLAAATAQVNSLSNDLSAAKIKPLKERIIDLLNSLNSQIIIGFKQGKNVDFDGNVILRQCDELQAIVKEPGASEYITSLEISPNADLNAAGTFHEVKMNINAILCQIR